MATSRAACLLAASMPRSSSGVPWRPPEMRAECTDTPSGAMRQNSVSIVVLIDGTSKPILPRHPYMLLLLAKIFHDRSGVRGKREGSDVLPEGARFPAP